MYTWHASHTEGTLLAHLWCTKSLRKPVVECQSLVEAELGRTNSLHQTKRNFEAGRTQLAFQQVKGFSCPRCLLCGLCAVVSTSRDF